MLNFTFSICRQLEISSLPQQLTWPRCSLTGLSWVTTDLHLWDSHRYISYVNLFGFNRAYFMNPIVCFSNFLDNSLSCFFFSCCNLLKRCSSCTVCSNFRVPLAAKCLRTNMQSCWPSSRSLGRRSGPHMLEVRVQWRDWKEVSVNTDLHVCKTEYSCM